MLLFQHACVASVVTTHTYGHHSRVCVDQTRHPTRPTTTAPTPPVLELLSTAL